MGRKRGRPVGSVGDRVALLRKIYDELHAARKIDDKKVQQKLYELACKGSVAAISEYNDRRFGKSPQALEHSGDVTTRYVLETPHEMTREQWLAQHVASQKALREHEGVVN